MQVFFLVFRKSKILIYNRLSKIFCCRSMLDKYLPFIESIFYPLEDYLGRFLISIFLLIFFFGARRILLRYVAKKGEQFSKGWSDNSFTIVVSIGIIGLIVIWLPHLRNFFTIFSIIGTGLIIASKEPVLNIAGWFYIILRRPFDIGNRVGINGLIGDVIDIRLFEFSMMEVKPREEGGQSTGRVCRVPNGLLFSSVLANSSKEFSLYWNEIVVNVTLNSNWEKARELIYDIAKETLEDRESKERELKVAKYRHSIQYANTEPKVYMELKDSKIQLTLRHLSKPRKTRDITDSFWMRLLMELKNHDDIDIC